MIAYNARKQELSTLRKILSKRNYVTQSRI